MPEKGEVIRTEQNRDGYIILRENGAEIFALNPRGGGRGGQNNRPRIGDIVEFTIENRRGQDQAINVRVIPQTKPLELKWAITEISPETATLGRTILISITPSLGNKVPVGLRFSLTANETPITLPVEHPISDGNNPIFYKLVLEKDCKSRLFLATVQEQGKLPLSYTYNWKYKAPEVDVLKVEVKGTSDDRTMVYIYTGNKESGKGMPAEVNILSMDKFEAFGLGAESGNIGLIHTVDTDDSGNAYIILRPGKGVLKTQVNFNLAANNNISAGQPLAITGGESRVLEMTIKETRENVWVTYEISTTNKKGEVFSEVPVSITAYLRDGSVLNIRKVGENDWQDGTKPFDSNGAIRLQAHIERWANTETVGEYIQFVAKETDGTEKTSDPFYIPPQYGPTHEAVTAVV